MTRRRALLMLAMFGAAACVPPRTRGAATARRIVSVTPATTEALFAVGAGDRVVGRSRFCDYPPEVTRIPAVGGFIDVDLEALLELSPDLVVGAPLSAAARIADELDARGVATWFPPGNSLADVDAMIAGLGERTDHAADARGVVDTMRAHARAIETAVASEPRPRVLLLAEVEPVVAAGPSSFADELIRRAGGVNGVLEGHAWQTLGLETIVDIDPEVIVDLSMGGGGASRIASGVASGWNTTRAARQGRVLALDDVRLLRPGPRVADGLAVLARVLHPGVAIP
jgi:iron complex transport system substrate-binding protein